MQGSYRQGKLGNGEENLRKVRENQGKQVKSGNFFHGLEKFFSFPECLDVVPICACKKP